MAKTIVIFPGGFHPPHAGHVASFNALKDAFPGSEAFMASTGYTAERPFPFEKKKALAIAAGIPKDSFVEVKSPYVAIEITKKFDKEKDFLVFGVSEKDADRFTYTKKDGSPGYFQKWTPDVEMVPFAKHAYIYITPILEFKVAGKIVTSASAIRKMYKDADEKTKKIILKDLYPNANLEDIKDLFDEVLKEVYMPKKYRAGLSKSTAGKRKRFWVKLGKYPYTKAEYSKAEKVPGDAKSETRPSQYNKKYQQMFGESRSIKALQKKAKATGIPYGILKQVYNRGMAAWVTGHRPGASQSAWAFARVNSFVTKGKTWRTADADLAKKARKYLNEDQLNEASGTNWAWYWVPMKGLKVRKYDPNKSGGEHESMAGELGLDDIDELPRGQFWISDEDKKQTSHTSYNWTPMPPKDIHLQLRKYFKIPKDWSHYTKWIIGDENIKEAHIFDYFDWGWITPTGEIIKPTSSDSTHTAILRRLAEEQENKYNISPKESEFSATNKGWIRWLVNVESGNFVLSFNTRQLIKKITIFKSIERIMNQHKDSQGFMFEWFPSEYTVKRVEENKFGAFKQSINKVFGLKENLEEQDMDYEIEMASGQLKKIIDLATNTLNYIQNKSELDSWIQDKISVSAHNMEAIFDYFHYSEEKIEEKIIKKNKKYFIFSKDGKKKLGGPYTSKKKATKRLSQIEFFKHLNK